MTEEQTVLSSAIAQRTEAQQAPGPNTVEARLRLMGPEFAKVLTPTLPVDTFLRLALNEVRTKPELLRCTEASFMGALMTAARLQLEPGGPLGQFYLTPRKINGVWQVVPIIGYRGLRDLALRTGRVSSIQSFIVRDGDEFTMGSNETRGFWHEWTPLRTDEDDSDRAPRGVLTIAQLTGSGKPVWRYLDRRSVLNRKARGAAGDKGPWGTDPDAMWRKTGIRAIAPDLPSSSIMSEAVRADEQVQVWAVGQPAPQPVQQIEAAPSEQHQPEPEQQQQPEPPAPEQERRPRKSPEPPRPARRRAPAVEPEQAPPMVAQGMPAPPPPDIVVEDPPEEDR